MSLQEQVSLLHIGNGIAFLLLRETSKGVGAARITTVNNERKAQMLRIIRILRKKKDRVQMSCLQFSDTMRVV